MKYEYEYEIIEAHCNAAAGKYFDARPELDSPEGRKCFEDAFHRAWKAARSGRHSDGRLIAPDPFVQAE